MGKILILPAALITLGVFCTTAQAVDGRGLTDGSIYDHKGVSPYEPRERGAPVSPVPPADQADHRSVLKCYWTVKTTDGWWPTGATQVCYRQRVE
ncbi:MAG: hypothetical protein AAGF81_12755 [Pseudomonadota bacterium]